MSRPSHLAAREYAALKSAFAGLVEAIGGQTAAARIVRVRQAQISNYCSLAEDQAECFPPLDVIADIEAEVSGRGGRPLVAELLAEMAGYDLQRREASGRAALLRMFGGIAAATTTMVAEVAADLADGTVDPAEAAEQRRLIRALQEQLDLYDAALQRITAGPVSVIQGGLAPGRRP